MFHKSVCVCMHLHVHIHVPMCTRELWYEEFTVLTHAGLIFFGSCLFKASLGSFSCPAWMKEKGQGQARL